MTNTDTVKLVGGKRKNGHKMDCDCHICVHNDDTRKREYFTYELIGYFRLGT